MKNVIALIISLAFTACGDLKEAMAPQATPTPAPIADTVTFQGSAQYAFEITVDGEKFNDIEHYYTMQTETLKDKVVSAGYNADKVEFIGELGFDDFIKDMTVFVSSSTGTQGKTTIDSQGNFSVDVANPNQDKRVTFKVRATKRIQVVLSSGSTVTGRLCYNFSAVEQDVIENPISLNTFETSRTLYDCDQVSEGMVIPPASTKVAPSRSLSFDSEIKAVWTMEGSNEFYVDTKTQRQLFVLPRNGSNPVAVGVPETYTEAPVGFVAMSNSFAIPSSSNAFTVSSIPFSSETVRVKGTSDWSEVSVMSNNVVTKSFNVAGYGIGWVAVSGSKIMGLAREDGNNKWVVGVLDTHVNKFVPMATTSFTSAYLNTTVGLVDGIFTAVNGSQIQFFSL
jgi:hypothetical protein